MSLFSFFRKNKQESAADDGAFYSRAEEESKAVRARGKRGKNGRGEPPIDPVLPEKKRARRRLVGAIALVLAAIIGLPMMFDSEPKPLANDIAIQIPSRDVPVAAESAPVVANSLGSGEELVGAETAVETPQPDPVTTAVAPAPSDQPKTEAPQVVAKPAQPPAPKPEVKAPRTAEKVDDSARALALLEGRPDPAADKKAEKFVIQVAALATRENVDDLQARLKDAGIKSYTEQIATAAGPRTRIRVGPFSSRDEAEKVRAKIVKIGLPGTVVPA